MKKKTLLHFWLLLCLMVAGATNAWADEVSTLTFTDKCGGSGTADDGVAWTVTSDGTESNFDGTKGIHYGTGNAQVQYIKLSTSDISGTITKVVVNASTASGVSATVDVTVGGNAFGGDAQSLTSTAADYTFTGSASGEIVITVTKPSMAAKALYVKSVAITYSASDPGHETSDLALTGAPVALNFNLYNNASAQVINYTTSSTGAVTIPESDYATFAIDEENKTITVTPKAVTPAEQTITVSQAADEYYKAGSVTFTVTVTDSTPIPTYTVTLGDDSSTLTEETGGAGVILPSRDALNGYTFVGWSEENVSTETTEAPVIIAAGAYAPTTDVTLYPVYSKTVGGGGSTNKAADVTISEYASANKWTNGTAFQPLIMDANISVGGEISGNNFKYYSSDNSWRFYTNGSFTISASNGATLSSVTLTFNGGALSYNSKSITSETAFDVEGTSAVINCTSNAKITAISVNYTIAGSGTTYYCSTPVSKADPELSFSETSVNGAIGTEFTAPTLNAADGFNGTVWYESSDESVAQIMDDETGELRLVGEGTATITATFAGNDDFQPGSASYTLTVTDNRIVTTTSYEDIELDLTEIGNLTRLAPVVKDADDKAVEYFYDEWPTEMSFEIVSDENGIIASLDNNTGEIILNSVKGTATLKAYYNAFGVSQTYKPSECTFTISVIDTHAPGAVNNPYSVAEAIDAIDNGGDVTGVYAQGIVSEIVTEYSSTYHNISYNISADGTTDGAQLQAFRGKSYNGENFTSAEDIQVGDVVVVYGDLIKYNTTYEFAQNNQLVSRVRKATPTLAFTEESYTVEKNGELTITAETNSDATIVYTSSDPEVADINAETGVVTAKEAGTTTITATVAETANFKSASVEIELTVTDPDLAMDITLNTTGNGNIECDKEKANEGETVTLTATPDEGYKLTGWTIIDGEANEVEYVADGNIATFTMPATDVEVEASFAEIKYFDVVFSVAGEEYGDGETVEEGATLTLPEDPTIEGVTFAGWSITDDVTAPEFVSNATVVEDDMILYAMFVAKAGANEYRKVTSTEDITIGQYLIVYEEGKVAFNGSLTELDKSDNNVAVTITDGTIASSDAVDAAVFAIDPAEGTLLSASGFYVGQTSDANGMKTSETETYTNSFEIDTDGNADIVSSVGAHLRYNSTSGQTRFRYFKSSSYTNQKAIALYKKIASAPVYFDGKVVETLTLNEGEGYEGTNIIYAKNVELNRTVKAETWNSFTVPFDIPAEQLPEFVEVKKLSSSTYSSEKDYVTLTFETATSIESGVPYMIRSTEQISNINLRNVVVDPTLNDIETTYAVMKGNMNPMNVPDGAFFISSNTWYEAAAGKTAHLNAFRAYIELTEAAQAAGARGFEMNIDGEVTRIDTISQSGNAQFNGAVYDLSGRKIEKPVRGLYIVNGKKVLVK